MTQTEVLKIALEALEGAEALLSSMGLTHLIVYGDVEKAVTEIEEALAQQSPQRSEDTKERSDWNEQVEPAFWYRNEDIFGNQEMEPIFYATKAWVNCLPLYTHPPVPTEQTKQLVEKFDELAQPEQESDDLTIAYMCGVSRGKELAQRTWVGLMRGVRVEGDNVVISVKGGNDAARELCAYLIDEMN